MEMNPFKPIIQFCEELYAQKFFIRNSINKLYPKISLAKAKL